METSNKRLFSLKLSPLYSPSCCTIRRWGLVGCGVITALLRQAVASSTGPRLRAKKVLVSQHPTLGNKCVEQ